MERFIKGQDRKNIYCKKWDNKPVNGKEVLPFWIADSDYPTYEKITNKLIERVKNATFGYTYIDDDYYNNVINWFNRRYGYKIEKENVFPTHGVLVGLTYAVHLFTKPGDKIVCSTPVYNPFFSIVKDNGRELVFNKLVETKNENNEYTYVYDFADLEEKIKDAKIYILCNPHNPVGRVWTKEEVSKIVSLCKKYDCILVSDEIHCDLVLEGSKLESCGKYLDEYDKIIILTAPSKTFNIAGLLITNCIIKNKEYIEAFINYQNLLCMERPNLLALEACKAAYFDGDEWVDTQNKYLKEQSEIVKSFFEKNLPMCKVYKLEGTYLMWVDCSSFGFDQANLIEGLLQAGVRVNSGTVYCEDCKGFIRLNVACGRSQLLEGLERIKAFFLKEVD